VSANTLSKALIYIGGGCLAACAIGGAVPIGMVSRASPARDKYHALLLAIACR
jgi:phosphotransacetylase